MHNGGGEAEWTVIRFILYQLRMFHTLRLARPRFRPQAKSSVRGCAGLSFELSEVQVCLPPPMAPQVVLTQRPVPGPRAC